MDEASHCSGEDRQDKGSKNKRKSAHPSTLPTNMSSSLIEFPRYELPAEISLSPMAEVKLAEMGSDRFREEPEVQVHELVEWNDPIASQLEELLLSNLHALFHSAIRQIVQFGYSENVAEKAISRKGLYTGEGDLVSNIVHDTLNVLKGTDVTTSSRDIVFDNFQHLLYYTMAEMISVLREVRPLTVGETMWLLLTCDLNISLACAVGEENLSGFCKGQSSASSSNPQSKSEVEISDTTLANCSASNFYKDSSASHQKHMSEAPKSGSFLNSPNNGSPLSSDTVKLDAENASLPCTAEKFSGALGECGQVAPQLSASESKLGPSSKRHNRKELVALRQKFLHIEKTYRACGKGGFKSGKIASISGFVVEKRLKPPSDFPNQRMKCGSSNMTSMKAATADGWCDVSTNAARALPAGGSSGTLPTKDAISTSQVGAKTSTSENKLKPKSEQSASDTNKILDYCARIPYDEALGKYVPRDQKDELTLKLVSRLQELQNELQSWNCWAYQKVMQVTHKLSKDQAELESLRKERHEAELCKKEQKILEENAMKRIYEMENAMANTRSQIENANSAARTLEAENYLLKKELDAAKLLVLKSMARHQQALEREQMALKKAQLWESQKGLLLDELEREKHKLANLQQEVDKEQNLQAKVEGRLEQERVAKEKLLALVASLRKESQQLEAHAKVKDDMIRKKAANAMHKYVEDVAKLEKELADLKLKSESAKVAALRRGIDGSCDISSRNSNPVNSDVSRMMVNYQDKTAAGSLRREQECVMCLSDERSVVFLPCAHQVVCAKCNELHENQGMKDCPSCRTPIQLRIHARFPGQ